MYKEHSPTPSQFAAHAPCAPPRLAPAERALNAAERAALVEATIVEADAVVKGQTASSSYKPAMLDNGVRVMVPPHIGAGTRIVVDVYEQTYVRRAE